MMQTVMHIERDAGSHVAFCGVQIGVHAEWYLAAGGSVFIQSPNPPYPMPNDICAECSNRKHLLESRLRAYVTGKLPPVQGTFDLTIGQLDRVLSKLVLWGKDATLDEADKQTLKHHAEDMIAAGQKILKDLGRDVEGTPQPGDST